MYPRESFLKGGDLIRL
jgi:hypothetical protein